MGRIGSLISSAIEDFIVQTVESRLGFNQDCVSASPSGIEAIPISDDRILLSKVDGTGKWIAHSVITEPKGAKAGDVWLYSRDENGELKASVKINADGTIEVNASDSVTLNLEKDCDVTINGNANISVSGDSSIETSGACSIKGQTVEVSGSVTVTGGDCTIAGTVAPTGSGAFCGIPNCVFSGAPQCGSMSSGT